MAGTLHLDSPPTIESQPEGLDARLVGGDAYQEEASLLLARFISARAAGVPELLIEVQCDIGAFVCHLAREVEAGEAPASILEFYSAHFSEMAR
ncbi:hypothetical protein [Pseudomonas baetica]|uniref:hypothetical protein n=1 Tax=Pseudomonas baetica TaxID=674054 RepID=UPI002406EF55|nr:hypothetical protein [Pseudomonas baetica]MDF9779072.1 hypothetical protein [Pseudomonas baetica]